MDARHRFPDAPRGLRERMLENLPDPEPTAEEMAWEELDFRRRLLGVCGFDDESALALAIRPGLGLREPLELVASGCPPAVAAAIVL